MNPLAAMQARRQQRTLARDLERLQPVVDYQHARLEDLLRSAAWFYGCLRPEARSSFHALGGCAPTPP